MFHMEHSNPEQGTYPDILHRLRTHIGAGPTQLASQNAIADAAGIPRATFSRKLRGLGGRAFDLPELERIAAALGADLSTLTGADAS